MSFEIKISISSGGVTDIRNTGQYVNILQEVDSSPSGSLVAWMVFPAQATSTLSFDASYFLYASQGGLPPDGIVTPSQKTSETVQEGWLYTLDSNGFSGASGSGTTYNVLNQENAVGVGLLQTVKLNQVPTIALLNAAQVQRNQTVSFTPTLKFSIFLSPNHKSGALSGVPNGACSFTLTSDAPTVNVDFNDANGKFSVAS